MCFCFFFVVFCLFVWFSCCCFFLGVFEGFILVFRGFSDLWHLAICLPFSLSKRPFADLFGGFLQQLLVDSLRMTGRLGSSFG